LVESIEILVSQRTKHLTTLIKFGSIQGEAYKRIPPELQSTFEKEPLIANKQFYYVAEKDAKFALSDNLNDVIVDYWLTAKPLNDFFS